MNTSPTVVIKVGTSSICDEKTFIPKLANLSLLVETISELLSNGYKVVLVTSGAIGVGLRRLKLSKKPKKMCTIQGIAAVGQGRLMALYDALFTQYDIPIGQILLTRENLTLRNQYNNACGTVLELLEMGVLPIVNENDSVCSEEIRFGDNDSLAAVLAGMIHAEYLFLLTDVDGLYTDDPRTCPDAKRIKLVTNIAEIRASVTVSSPGSLIGTGGMVTKLIAAELATSVGCRMIITLGSKPKILEILNHLKGNENSTTYEPEFGTHFIPAKTPLNGRKRWITHGLVSSGTIWIDQGAKEAITGKAKSSLFSAGIVEVEGNFYAQQCVSIKMKEVTNEDGKMIEKISDVGRGISSYSGADLQKIKGCSSSMIEDVLGYMSSEYVIHRDNLAIL